MLLRNGISANVIPLSLTGIGWQNFVHDSAVMNQANSSGFSALSAYPTGLYPPHCMIPPRTAGRMAAHDTLIGVGTLSASALAVKLANAGITGTGDLAAIGGLIVQALASISGTGTISTANLQAFLAAVADLSGSGTVSAGTLTAIGELIAALAASGTATGSTATGIGELDADIVVTGTGLSTANVGQAVWAAVAAANNVPGTMGERLNDAGSAGNPWTTVIESGFTAEEVLRLIAAAVAGKVSGAASNAPVFRDLGDTKDRITAVTDDDGNRVSVTHDPS